MHSLSHFTITRVEDTPIFDKLYKIFTATLNPGMDKRMFRAFYDAPELQYIDITFLEANGAIVGFCAAAFYGINVNGKANVVGRAAIGIQEGHRGGALPVSTLFYKFIRYKLHHPLARLVLTGFIANPLIYDMICKYTGWAYPREGQKLPAHMCTFHQAVVPEKSKAPGKHPMVVKLHFHVHQGADMVQRVMNSASRYVKDYLRMNPDYDGKYGLVVLVPVTWANIGVSAIKLAWKNTRLLFKHKYR